MDYFNLLSRKLLEAIPNGRENLERDSEIIIHRFSDGRVFKLVYKGYNGKMAIPSPLNPRANDKYKRSYMEDYNKRRNLGYFDFVVDTSDRYYDGNNRCPVTHKRLFRDLIRLQIQEKCELIWRGESPFDISNDEEEQQALLTLALLMFEQEINWGNNSFQKFTHFSPEMNCRPRDMIMGMLNQAFTFGVDGVFYWSGDTANFGGSYDDYDKTRKEQFFTTLVEDAKASASKREAKPLMIGKTLEQFKFKVMNKSENLRVSKLLSNYTVVQH